ncbi:MAG: hypothetical protein DRJ26_02495 [Candidatus Methanomethylicota archaeon]|uniref:Uncharacterized protein n=1 Tax=Thermoproteota archaeon TaxID=2056631 RepID=A0A497F4X7_9CREN|nr:MAG: hypothetical protein DRJ26_02495 [Candidatus Verstraetearchaeota archaeon]
MLDSISTLGLGIKVKIVDVKDDRIIVYSEKTKKTRVLSKKRFKPFWEALLKRGFLHYKKDLHQSDWAGTGAIIIAFLARLPYIEYSVSPCILYLKREYTHKIGTLKRKETES